MLPPNGSPIDGAITSDGFGTLPNQVTCEIRNGKPKLPTNLEDIARQMTQCEPFKDNSICACKDVCPLSNKILGPHQGSLEYSPDNVPNLDFSLNGSDFDLGKLGFIKKMNNFATYSNGAKPSKEELLPLLKKAMAGELVNIKGFKNLSELVQYQDYKDVLNTTIRKEQNFRLNTLNSLDVYDEFTSEKERNNFLFNQVVKNLKRNQRPIVTFPDPISGDAKAYLASSTKDENGQRIVCLHNPSKSYEDNSQCKNSLTMTQNGQFLLKSNENPEGKLISEAGVAQNQEIDMQRMSELQGAGLSPQEDADYLLAVHAHSKTCKEKMVACQPKSLDENFDRLFSESESSSITLSASPSGSSSSVDAKIEGPKDQVQAVAAILGNSPSPITLNRVLTCNSPVSPLCALEKTFGSKEDAKRAMVVYKETGFVPNIKEPSERNVASDNNSPLPSSGVKSHRKNTDVSNLKDGSGEKLNTTSTGLFRRPKMINGQLEFQTCTATIVAPSVVLTSSACLDDKPDATGAHVLFNSQKGTPMSERIKVNCSRVISMDTKKHLVLLQCDGRPGDHFGVTEFSKDEPNQNEEVYTIHHPKGGEKSFTTGKVTKSTPQASLIRSDLLIDQGSGGSMVFSSTDHKALGMNFGGSPDKKEGFAIDSATIHKFINENSPSLETGRRYPAGFSR
ncbi:MAG: trypsin-like peptidase domain-containing protein [Bacteriovoracaceae bacterium]|nr:trypsin-like peptidase domain-containing protein [Bacteriovoracaceae bacterium]